MKLSLLGVEINHINIDIAALFVRLHLQLIVFQLVVEEEREKTTNICMQLILIS